LALVYKSQENYDKAIELMKKSITILEKNSQSAQQDIKYQIADALATLADLFITVNRLDEAEKPLDQSINILLEKQNQLTSKKNIPSEELSKMSLELNQMLGILYDSKSKLRLKQKRYADAEVESKKSIEILRKLQVNERDLVNFHIKLAEILLLQGKSKEACEIYNKILNDKESEEGSNISLAISCKLFANNCLKHNFQSAAEELYSKSLKILERQRTDRKDIQEDMIDIMNCLVTIYKETERNNEASTLLTKLKGLMLDYQLQPPLTVSKFFVTERATLDNIDDSQTQQKNSRIINIKLHIRNSLPEGAIIVTNFPKSNEDEKEEIIEQKLDSKDQKEIFIKSSPRLIEDEKIISSWNNSIWRCNKIS